MNDADHPAEAIALRERGLEAQNRGELAEAERCLREAFEGGLPLAGHDLASLLLDRGDKAGAEEWYRRAADLGNAGAAFNLGFVWEDRGEPAKRMEAWERAADLGHPKAAYVVADLHLSEGDVEEGVAWHRMARFWNEFPQGPTFYSPEFQAFASELSAASIHQQDVFNNTFGGAYVEWNLEEATVSLDGRTLQGLTSSGVKPRAIRIGSRPEPWKRGLMLAALALLLGLLMSPHAKVPNRIGKLCAVFTN